MSENVPSPSEPLSVQKIHHLVRLMKRYDLTHLDISDGPVQIRLRRRGPELPQLPAHYLAHQPAAPLPVAPAPGTHPAQPQAEASPGPKTVVIESPIVGTFYASSSPDTPPFVAVGSVVQPDTTLCIIEAMKVFTDIPSGVSGTITEILVKNGQPVEFGQPLFRVIPA